MKLRPRLSAVDCAILGGAEMSVRRLSWKETAERSVDHRDRRDLDRGRWLFHGQRRRPRFGWGVPACAEIADRYPPETVTMIGSERVEIPFTSWECPGYNADTFDEDMPLLRVGPDGKVLVNGEMRDGVQLDVRALVGGEVVQLDVAIKREEALINLPEGAGSLLVRMCTADARCANYEADIGS